MKKLIGALLAALAVGSAGTIITSDGGGSVVQYAWKYYYLRQSGERVVIDGY